MIKREKSDFRYSGAVDIGDETKGCWLYASILEILSNQLPSIAIRSNQVLHNEQDCSDLARGLTINYDLNQLIYFDSLSSLCHCLNSNYAKFFFLSGL